MNESSKRDPGVSKREACPPLAGLKAVDLTDTRGAYAARLLADLGVEVIRIQFRGEISTRTDLEPSWTFNNLSKAIIELDEDEAGQAHLHALLATADVIVTDAPPARLRELGLDHLADRYPRLVHLSVSPWGLTGPRADEPASDLTLLAAGGLLSLAGEPDGPPVRAFPEQSSVAASLHGAVGALIALLARDGDFSGPAARRGQVVDVSAQEAVAHSLENAAQYVDLEGVVRHRTGSQPSEAGSGLFRCLDGYVYLVTGIGGVPLAWAGLIKWLQGSGSPHIADAFEDARWQDRAWRRSREATEEFRGLFEQHARTRAKVELCEEGQAHGVSISPVSTAADLLSNEQLVERGFFRVVGLPDGRELTVPGPPYRFDDARLGPFPTHAGQAPEPGTSHPGR